MSPDWSHDRSDIVIRDINGSAEVRAVEALQKEVWAMPDLDVVPLTQLVAAAVAGGVVIGAFDGDVVAGFAYGFVGLEDGQLTHHSHMLAVKTDYRCHNIGYRLKLEQRRRVMEQGIEKMSWTYDPLQSLNAHFNFGKLGVTSDKYFVDFYGTDASSFLHRSGTDRLWVTWDLASPRVVDRLNGNVGISASSEAVTLLTVGSDKAPRGARAGVGTSAERASIEIPGDFIAVQNESRELAMEWREATRRVFTEAIAAGYRVNAFEHADRGNLRIGRYKLDRKSGEI